PTTLFFPYTTLFRSVILELTEHLLVMGDRAGYQLREEADEKAVADEIVFVHLAVMGVDQIGNLLKGKKGDGQRQDDVAHRPAQVKGLVERAEKKPGVFVVAEQGDVGGNPQYQQ